MGGCMGIASCRLHAGMFYYVIWPYSEAVVRKHDQWPQCIDFRLRQEGKSFVGTWSGSQVLLEFKPRLNYYVHCFLVSGLLRVGSNRQQARSNLTSSWRHWTRMSSRRHDSVHDHVTAVMTTTSTATQAQMTMMMMKSAKHVCKPWHHWIMMTASKSYRYRRTPPYRRPVFSTSRQLRRRAPRRTERFGSIRATIRTPSRLRSRRGLKGRSWWLPVSWYWWALY